MVLFLFIIMLLDIKTEEGKKMNLPAIVSGVLLAVLLTLQIMVVVSETDLAKKTTQNTPLALAEAAGSFGKTALPTITNDLKAGELPDAKLIGLTLFDQYGFHLQVIGLLLLVGTIGVVVLSKRERSAP